jgi:hypothetical protein
MAQRIPDTVELSQFKSTGERTGDYLAYPGKQEYNGPEAVVHDRYLLG